MLAMPESEKNPGQGRICMSGKIFLDTNVLVYAHDSEPTAKREISRNLIFDSLRNGNSVISPQVLSEFFVTVTQKIATPISAEQAKKVIMRLAVMTTVDIDVTMVIRAIEIKGHYQLSYWDGLIIAAAERARCASVYTEDLSANQSYGSVTAINPFS